MLVAAFQKGTRTLQLLTANMVTRERSFCMQGLAHTATCRGNMCFEGYNVIGTEGFRPDSSAYSSASGDPRAKILLGPHFDMLAVGVTVFLLCHGLPWAKETRMCEFCQKLS